MNASRTTEGARATRVGAHALRRIATPSGVGRVVSAFRGGVNVRFDGVTPALVAVQTAGVAFHPWAVEVPALPSDLAHGAAVCTTASLSGAALFLDLRGAERCELLVAPYSREAAARARSRIPRLELPSGDRARRGDPREPFDPRLRAALAEWRTNRKPHVLLSLVGLGSGSTPAGDDLLVGLLAGLTALRTVERDAARHLEALREDLSEVSLPTPLASRQMIAAAIGGSFPEPIRELVSALGHAERTLDVTARAACVDALGASSGGSFIAGLKAALDSTSQISATP